MIAGRARTGHREPARRAGRRAHSLAQGPRAGRRTTSATAGPARPIGKLLPPAEKLGVYLNIENIFFNGYLLSPQDMNAFVDSFKSKHVRVHFDTGNIMLFQFPEDWIAALGKRIKNVHLKEFTKKGTDHSLESFRPLLDGTTNWPAVMEAFDKVGYRGYLTFEYFHPFPHYPGGADLSDVGRAGPHAGQENVDQSPRTNVMETAAPTTMLPW